MNKWSARPHVFLSRFIAVPLLAVTWAAFAQDLHDRVVFVCEHGSVKSLIAASLFDQTAADRGLPYRAVSRGVNPDERVPPGIAAATRIIAIGVDLSAYADETRVPIQSWDDVPAASVDYPAARAALQRSIDALLDDLQEAERTP